MPARPESVELTNRYRATLLDLRQRGAALAASTWLALAVDDLQASYEAWLAGAVGVVEGLKRQGVALTDGYLAAFVAGELGTAPKAQGLDPEPYLVTEDGRSMERALLPPMFTVAAAVKAGRPDALRLGMVRATRIIAEEVLAAPRRALGDAIQAETRVEGWVRVTGGNPCGACLANASGHVHSPDEPFKRHGHCRCMREPVVRGVPQTYRRPTGREHFDALSPAAQAALFHGRGGEEKADLVRSGAVPFEALVRHEHQEVMPDQFTEASLSELRSLTGP